LITILCFCGFCKRVFWSVIYIFPKHAELINIFIRCKLPIYVELAILFVCKRSNASGDFVCKFWRFLLCLFTECPRYMYLVPITIQNRSRRSFWRYCRSINSVLIGKMFST
jgi:hypothetical protein